MANICIMDAKDFDVSKSYYKRLKKKEELCYVVLDNYTGQELNKTVKCVIIGGEFEVEEVQEGVTYFKRVEYDRPDVGLTEFLGELIDPTDIYCYLVNLPSNFNDLRELTGLVGLYTDKKVRFIGGNLINLEGCGVGVFSDDFITTNKIKTKPTIRYDFTHAVLIPFEDLTIHDYEEYEKRRIQPKKPKTASSKRGSSSSGSRSSKPKNTKKSIADILNSY